MVDYANRWMPLYWGDLLGQTFHLNAEETGAMLLLMANQWQTGKPVPNDDYVLRRVAKVPEDRWERVRALIEPHFDVSDQGWSFPKVAEEIEKARELSRVRADAGRKGAKKTNFGKSPANAEQEPTQLQLQTQQQRQQQETATHTDDDACAVLALWNDFADRHGLSKAQHLTDLRKTLIPARLASAGGLEGFQVALEKVASVPGLLGQGSTFKCSLDFLLKEEHFTKIMEGGYDGWGSQPAQAAGTSGSGNAFVDLAHQSRTSQGA